MIEMLVKAYPIEFEAMIRSPHQQLLADPKIGANFIQNVLLKMSLALYDGAEIFHYREERHQIADDFPPEGEHIMKMLRQSAEVVTFVRDFDHSHWSSRS